MKKHLRNIIQEIKATESKLNALKAEAAQYDSLVLNKELTSKRSLQSYHVNEKKLKLEEQEKRFKEEEELPAVGRWSYSFETLEMSWSEESYKIFEYPEGFKGTLREFYLECLDDKTKMRIPEQGQKLRKSKEDLVMNHRIKTPNGNVKLLTLTSFPIYNSKKEIIGVEGLVKDHTEQIKGKKGLDKFFNLSYDLHCIVHADNYFIKVSPAWIKLLGYTEKELLSKPFLEFIHPDDYEKSKLTNSELNELHGINTFENRYITKSGKTVYLSWNSQLDEETQLAYCTARDITASKLKQDELLSNLSEKELLLKEIHHRVKNNLQIISSLLSLQAGANSEEKQLVKLYEESRDRIRSMAAIHEMFYQSEELDKIEFGKYLNKLIGDISKSTTTKQKPIDLDLDTELVFLNLDMAIPLGLMINEIVTNSIKYGADETGLVRLFIQLKSFEENQIELIIGDKGSTDCSDILHQDSEGLGIMLINSLVEQINGEIVQLNDRGGAVYKLTFSNNRDFNL